MVDGIEREVAGHSALTRFRTDLPPASQLCKTRQRAVSVANRASRRCSIVFCNTLVEVSPNLRGSYFPRTAALTFYVEFGSQEVCRMSGLEAASVRRAPYGVQPVRPFVALKAFRRVVANKDDTKQVFEVIRALSGRSIPRAYLRMVATREGGLEAFRACELSDVFENRDWLAHFSPGSVGSAYREFLDCRGYSAYGLADESRKEGDDRIDDAHPIAWYARRVRDIHDVWHVLTGYNTDALGEACLLGFTFAQVGNGALMFLALAAALELKRLNWRAHYIRAVLQGFDNGRAACRLDSLDYRSLFAEPLISARERLGICRPTFYLAVSPEARNGHRYPPEVGVPELWLASREHAGWLRAPHQNVQGMRVSGRHRRRVW